MSSDPKKCEAVTKRGQTCRQNKVSDSKFCENHNQTENSLRNFKPSRKSRNSKKDADDSD